MKTMKKYFFLLFTVGILIFLQKPQDVCAVNPKISVDKREKTDNIAIIRMNNLNMNNYSYVELNYEYERPDGTWDFGSIKSKKFLKKSKNNYYYILHLKQGTYSIVLEYGDRYGFYSSNEIDVVYDKSKPEFDGKYRDENGWHNPINAIGKYKKDGDTYYYKGTSARVEVTIKTQGAKLTNVTGKAGSVSGIRSSVGGIAGYKVEAFTFTGEVDGSLIFNATNEYGRTALWSSGKRLVIDNTKPIIKLDNEYSKEKTVYKKQVTDVPIEIIEKHFDSTGTHVTVDGKVVTVSWNSNGDRNTTKVRIDKGEHVIAIASTDKSGNIATEVKSAKIIVDVDAPKVKISGLSNRKSYGNKNGIYTPYSISIKLSDQYLTGRQEVSLIRINPNNNEKVEKVALNSEKKGQSIILTSPDIKNDGYYKLVINVKDKAGNTATKKSLDKQGEFDIKNGKVVGNFYINRNGSKYEIDNNSLSFFGSATANIANIIIYEYNINKIEKKDQEMTLITSLGSKRLILGNDYKWDDVSDKMADDKYQYVYRYTLYDHVFNEKDLEQLKEGIYSIKIKSSSEVIGDGNNSLKIEASNDSIMNQTIRIDTTKPEILTFKKIGRIIYIHIRDNNFDQENISLISGGKKIKLVKDCELSSSSNYYYTADVGGGLSHIELKCIDNAGNENMIDQLQSNINNTSLLLIVAGTVFAVLLLVIGMIVIILFIRKKTK